MSNENEITGLDALEAVVKRTPSEIQAALRVLIEAIEGDPCEERNTTSWCFFSDDGGCHELWLMLSQF